MEGGSVYGGSDVSILLQNESLPCSEVLDSLWISNSSSLHGSSSSMVNFQDVCRENTSNMQICQTFDKSENTNDDSDGCFHQPEKKRRLTVDQVHFLEKSFEVENKLEPERKFQLAKDLGLQPRQVAIWFQNRRARYKTKLLEKDYDSLTQSYDKLKADYEGLLKENDELKKEVSLLTDKLLVRDKGEADETTETCDPTYPLDQQPDNSIPNTASSPNVSDLPVLLTCKQEDASSAKSDVLDFDSPHYTDGNHSSLLEPANSSHVFEQEQSDFSQDEENDDLRSLLPFPCFPKIEDGYYDNPAASSCNLANPMEDQTFRFWSF